MRIYCLSSLEAKSLRSRCQHLGFLMRFVRQNLFHVCLLASGGFTAIFGIHWLRDGIRLSLYLFFPLYVSVCVQISPFYKDAVI